MRPTPYLFVLPHLAFFALFAAYPLLYGLYISLFNFDFAFPSFRPFVGLDNYAELARDGDLILFRIAASHYLWKMVRKLTSFLVEVGRGNERSIEPRLHAKAEAWQPTAPPSGLFLEAIEYEGEAFERPLKAIVPVESFARRKR